MIPDGLLTLMPNGRQMYKLQRGLAQMYWIRAWCGCRAMTYADEEADE